MRQCVISNLLGQLHADELNELDRQTKEVVRAIEETGKQGELNLKIVIKKNGQNSVMVAPTLKTKIPRPAPSERVLFFAYDDSLHATGDLAEVPHRQESLFESGKKPRVVQ